MALHPKQKDQIKQIIMFGFIWTVFGLLYVVVEYGLLGTTLKYPTTGNNYSVNNSIISVSIGGFIMGCLQGAIEILWLRNYLSTKDLWKKHLFKTIFYILLLILFLIGITIINNSMILKASPWDARVIKSIWNFFSNFTFWSIIIYIGITLNIALFYAEVKAYIGKHVVANYLGKYHRPVQETRIFMFLDMKSSTSIAERIGHQSYFNLLKSYYADMTNAVLETSGDIYQYVGDEIVVTWKAKKGLENNNCIHCYIKINAAIRKNKDYYQQKFGVVPEFKAGFHIGEVTAGEIGIIKKDIVYTGDVLNTAARIQAQCNTYSARTLISEELHKRLGEAEEYNFKKIGTLLLRGKQQEVQLIEVEYH